MPKMQPNAEAKVVHLDAECGGKKRKKRKQRKSKRQLEKIASASRERMSKFLQKKDEERALKGSLARQQALEQLGITQEFNHSESRTTQKFTTMLIMLWRPQLKRLMPASLHPR